MAYEQILWYVFVPSGVLYALLIIMTFSGLDADVDVESDFDADGDGNLDFDGLASVLTFRNAVYFAFGYSGGTLIGLKNGCSGILSTFLGLGLGIALVAITVGIMYLMFKLRQENIPSNDGLVGKTARRYLRINAGQSGKITVNLNGSTRELLATASEDIPTGSTVIIESINNGVAHVVKQI